VTMNVAKMWQDDQSRPVGVNDRQPVCAGQPHNANDGRGQPASGPPYPHHY